jgi:glutaredoxin
MSTITFFTRERCGLCHEALEALARVRERAPFELVVVDLDREAPPDKRAAYDHEVPVVELDGKKVMKFRVDEARLVRLLAAAAGAAAT